MSTIAEAEGDNIFEIRDKGLTMYANRFDLECLEQRVTRVPCQAYRANDPDDLHPIVLMS